MRAYKRAMNAVGVLAGLVAVAYLVSVAIATGDGPDGIEVPPRLAGLAIAAIVVLTVVSSAAWIVDRSNRFASELYIRPLIRAELEQLRPELVQAIVDDVAARMADIRDHDLRRVAQSVASLTVAGIREVVTDEMEECMGHVLAAGRRHGAVLEAQTRRYASTGTDHGIGSMPRAAGTAKVHPIRQFNTDDN